MIEFDAVTFKDSIQQSEPVVVDFWAPWCMPCKMFAPVLEELGDEMDGIATFGKINIDDYGDLAQEYSIVSIPTVIVFKNGEPIDRFTGVLPKQDVQELVRKYL